MCLLTFQDSQCNHSGDLSSGVLDERSSAIFAAKGIKASFIGGGQCKMGLTSLHELYGS